MTTVVSTSEEVAHVASEAVNTAIASLPYNSQAEEDANFATYFMLKQLASLVNPRIDKIEKKLKDQFRSGFVPTEMQSENYFVTLESGTPRANFDKDAFLTAIATAFPDVPKHKLVELAEKSVKMTAAPVSIRVFFKGIE